MNTINEKDCLLLIIDIQEKLVKMINNSLIINNATKIAKTARILNLPTIITEQYPKGLGNTIEGIKNEITDAKYLEKTNFSALNEFSIEEEITKANKKQIIILGIETHICVLQTAFDLLKEGYEVFVIKDASASRSEENNNLALQRLIQAGAQILSTEMVIFELLKSSKHSNFKEIQALVK